MKTVVIFAAAIVLNAISFLHGQTASTLQVDFIKIESRGHRGDTVAGTMYSFDNHLVIDVRMPIAQKMVIDSSATLIYNYRERFAVRLRRKNPARLPFFETFISFFSEKTGGPQMNFHISGSTVKNDSLITQWAPQEKKTSFDGRLETVYYKDLPNRASLFDKKGRLISIMRYSQDSLVFGHHVPFRITTIIPQVPETMVEDVVFSRLQTGKSIPAEILHFKIPPEVRIKVMEW